MVPPTDRAGCNPIGLGHQVGRCEAERSSGGDQVAVTCGQYQLRIGYLPCGSEVHSVVPSQAELFSQPSGTSRNSLRHLDEVELFEEGLEVVDG